MAADASITLHSSWRGIVTSTLGALIVLAIGSAAVSAAGLNVVTGLVLVVGVVLALGVAFDYPLASTFDAGGVTRRTMLRRHRIDWESVHQLSRTRPGIASLQRLRLGGFVAVIGKRRYLLVDQSESGQEFDDLDAVLGDTAVSIGLDEMIRPAEETAPTWLYRRKRWHRTTT